MLRFRGLSHALKRITKGKPPPTFPPLHNRMGVSLHQRRTHLLNFRSSNSLAAPTANIITVANRINNCRSYDEMMGVYAEYKVGDDERCDMNILKALMRKECWAKYLEHYHRIKRPSYDSDITAVTAYIESGRANEGLIFCKAKQKSSSYFRLKYLEAEAACYAELRDYRGAIDALNKAKGKTKLLERVYVSAIEACNRADRPNEALALYREMSKIFGFDFKAVLNVVEALGFSNKDARLIEFLKGQAKRLKYRKTDVFVKAVKLCQKSHSAALLALMKGTDDRVAIHSVFNFLVGNKKWDEAIEVLRGTAINGLPRSILSFKQTVSEMEDGKEPRERIREKLAEMVEKMKGRGRFSKEFSLRKESYYRLDGPQRHRERILNRISKKSNNHRPDLVMEEIHWALKGGVSLDENLVLEALKKLDSAGKWSDAVELLEGMTRDPLMPKPTNQTVRMITKLCVDSNQSKHIHSLALKMRDDWPKVAEWVFLSHLEQLVTDRRTEEIFGLLEKISSSRVVELDQGNYHDILKCLKFTKEWEMIARLVKMIRQGGKVALDPTMVNYAMQSFVFLDLCDEALDLLSNAGDIELSAETYLRALSICMKARRRQESFELLGKLNEIGELESLTNVKDWHWDEVFAFLDEVEEKSYQLNSKFFNLMLRRAEHELNVPKGVRLFERARDFPGMVLNLAAHNTMLSLFEKTGECERAVRFLEEMRRRENAEPNSLSYSTVVATCIACDKLGEARQVLSQMMERKVKIDEKNYNVVMLAYLRKGLWEEALGLYRKVEEYGVETTIGVFRSLVKACISAGEEELAEEIKKGRDQRS